MIENEFGWAVVSLMTSERLSAVSHTDGYPACFLYTISL